MNVQSYILSAENITKSYVSGEGKLEVLKGASLQLKAGEMAVLLGASGTGKSTLLHILSTLDKAESGRVLYRGVDISRLSPKELARFRNEKIGFVYQLHYLLPEFSALENVMMPGLIADIDRRQAKKIAKNLLMEVGLSGRESHRPNQLSGGEAQRVAIARALFNNPEVVYADEPTGNLDTKNGEALIELFRRLNFNLKQTFLIATHNERLASQIRRKFFIENGSIKSLAFG
ncbi:MAG: ABC transporter ATP-binding protein [candidate division Zixibacteria bacterium 4484_95]|nr:MAG: ABC transporter ATP-binding protein [candidate division Zixibacteria bacterium 4484_95]RKX20558.1 MAG: lipoprotein-releasing system ATP-binding protein LolD [candidate division Zixibacteria bacterium]